MEKATDFNPPIRASSNGLNPALLALAGCAMAWSISIWLGLAKFVIVSVSASPL
ncbi:MAG TPA: hypothetical protein PK225_04525 [Azonexus sp.]|jgi:hypothetical protein|nr:hypothetical protein [Dechloromonas sp.]HRH13599.1 hypothetical protein [Azonexus sp.]